MKKILMFCLIAGTYYTSLAQSGYTIVQWDTVDLPQHNLGLLLPPQPVFYDTLHTELITVAIDSILTLQVHIFDSAYINGQEPLIATALTQTSSDTMLAIAELYMLGTNSDLLSISDTIVNGKRSVDIGIAYQTNAAEVEYYSFTKYYYFNQKFFAFSVTGYSQDLTRLYWFRNKFFDSINFY